MTTPFAVGRVRDIMTSAPVCVRATTTIEELLRLFDEKDCNAFPVAESPDELMGIVTKLDLLRGLQPMFDLAAPDPARLADTTVESIMRRGVVTLDSEDTIAEAATLMLETQLRSIPVVHRVGGRAATLVGIVSRGDVIRGLRFALHRTD